MPILLAAANGPKLEIVFWVVAGAIWLISQIAAAKKRQKRKTAAQGGKPSFEVHRSKEEDPSPSADELSEIFKRLGADIPSTPPPKPKATARKVTPPRRPVNYNVVRKPPAAPVRPEIGQRLAPVKREATEAARLARQAAQTRRVDTCEIRDEIEACSLVPVAQHTGTVLPRLSAMGLQLSPFPSLPMPGANRMHHTCDPLPIRLKTRRDLRNAIIAQTFLSPAKGTSL